jgi:hypothetical protein
VSNIVAVEKKLIARTLGVLPRDDVSAVLNELRKACGL